MNVLTPPGERIGEFHVPTFIAIVIVIVSAEFMLNIGIPVSKKKNLGKKVKR